jgi:hypothetical protein
MATDEDLTVGLDAEKERGSVEEETIVVAPVVCSGIKHQAFNILSLTAFG